MNENQYRETRKSSKEMSEHVHRTSRNGYITIPEKFHRLSEIYKYMNNMYKTLARSYFSKPARSLRGHPKKLQVLLSRTDVRKNFFSNRAITLWNSLTERTVQATSIDAFKQKLRADLLELT